MSFVKIVFEFKIIFYITTILCTTNLERIDYNNFNCVNLKNEFAITLYFNKYVKQDICYYYCFVYYLCTLFLISKFHKIIYFNFE